MFIIEFICLFLRGFSQSQNQQPEFKQQFYWMIRRWMNQMLDGGISSADPHMFSMFSIPMAF